MNEPSPLPKAQGSAVQNSASHPLTASAEDTREPRLTGPPATELETITAVLEESQGRPEELDQLRAAGRRWTMQVNQGSIGYSVLILKVLLEALDRSPLLPSVRREVLQDAMDALSPAALSSAAAQPHTRLHLRELLRRLPPFRAERLLARLKAEQSRGQRRFFLEMLQVHGDTTREQAIALLSGKGHPWHFRRNLVYLLRKVRSTEGASTQELALVLGELEADTLQQRREAIRYLGEDPRPAASAALVRCLERVARGAEGEIERAFILEQLATQSCPQARGVALTSLLKQRHWRAEHMRLLKLIGLRELPPDHAKTVVRAARRLLQVLKLGPLAGASRRARLEGLVAALSGSTGEEVEALFDDLMRSRIPEAVASAVRTAREQRSSVFEQEAPDSNSLCPTLAAESSAP